MAVQGDTSLAEVGATTDGSGKARKRKLTDVEFKPVSQEQVQSSASSLCPDRTPDIQTAATLEEFYNPIQAALENLSSVFLCEAPTDAAGIHALNCQIRAACDSLNQVLNVKPRYGLTVASQVVDLLRTELVDRDLPGSHEYATCPGPYSLCRNIDTLLSELCGLSSGDLPEAIEDFDFAYELENMSSIAQYCLERFGELLEEERESERESSRAVQQILQQRLSASLAPRG